ncbi:MAG TPA: hypothetical protein VFF59_08265 [Anaerolineae bacterium]|nr:hypothetical protein [Anaerolineae bacterium]
MANFELVGLIDQTLARYTNDVRSLEDQLQQETATALEDWLLVEACKDYDTIDLDPEVTGKSRRKNFKALREKKRNIEKMIVALQALRETALAPEGEKLRKKFDAETEKYN